MSKEPFRIKAVGYDVDGTMVDSEPLHVAAWHEALEREGRKFEDLPKEFQATLAGRKPIAIASFMIESLRISTTPETFLAQKHEMFMQKVKTDLRPMLGVVESIKRFGRQYALG